MKKSYLFIIFIIIGLILLKYGRSIYMPYVHKLKGRETVKSIIKKTQKRVWDRLETDLNRAGYKSDYPNELILVGLKEEKILQVYAKDFDDIVFIKEYPFTAFSGNLGPKLKEGDNQIPEGIYKVEYLNPNSSYYLSIKVSYPNEFDKTKSKLLSFDQMGGDIFIHGKAATIGCIPIGDDAIEEVFLLSEKAVNNEIKVIICPWDFRVKSDFPKIENIEWENELYKSISNELFRIPSKP